MKMKQIILLCLLASSVAKANTTAWGEVTPLGNSELRTFAELDNNKRIVSLGVAIRNATLTHLPADMKMIKLRLPPRADLAPYKFIEVDWNPHGHEPPGVYDVPHFDFHFYTMPLEDVAKITCAGADQPVCMKMPPANQVADKYAPTPAGVPMMGWHWVDTLAPEFNGGKFSKTFIYGFYNGNVTFLEPMVTLEYLMSGANSTTPIRQPATFPKHGIYPRAYEVAYDSIHKVHYVRIKNFKTF
jgi:hypothetical protein